MNPTQLEIDRRREVVGALLASIEAGTTVRLPPFDPAHSQPGTVALHHVGIEPNPFSGTVSRFRYQFEGEEDLLHLIVMGIDGEPVSPEESQLVVTFLFPDLPLALLWFKPGEFTQHYYVGHDVLPEFVPS